MMTRDASLSENCTLDRCIFFQVWAGSRGEIDGKNPKEGNVHGVKCLELSGTYVNA